MRIWSVHPKYLDTRGLVALWRETLLAKYVLEGKTKGYKNHPQLNRFKACKNPLNSINYYLSEVCNEATNRGYKFNTDKINWNFTPVEISLTKGQLEYEKKHLLKKLNIRDLNKYHQVVNEEIIPHPIFKIKEGDIEDWEII